jgi:hypothetical protein
MIYLFVFTLGIVLLNLLLIITLLGKQKLVLPHYKHLDPTEWWIFYPSFFYQVYWWSIYLGFIK